MPIGQNCMMMVGNSRIYPQNLQPGFTKDLWGFFLFMFAAVVELLIKSNNKWNQVLKISLYDMNSNTKWSLKRGVLSVAFFDGVQEKMSKRFTVFGRRCEIKAVITASADTTRNIQYKLTLHLTHTRGVEYIVTFNHVIDITPNLSTFQYFSIDPYKAVSCLIGATDYEDEIEQFTLSSALCCTRIVKITELLLSSIMEMQLKRINDLVEILPALQFQISITKDFPGVVILDCKDDSGHTLVLIEFPLFHSDCSTDHNAQHIHNVTKQNPIMFTRELTVSSVSGSVLNVNDFIHCPENMHCSSHIDFSGFLESKTTGTRSGTDDFNLFDNIRAVERHLLAKISMRKSFTGELGTISALIEYDAIDYAFVVVAIRIKSQIKCTLCTAEFRLTSQFPDTMALVSVHDLTTNFSTPLDTSSLKYSGPVSPKKLANDLLDLVTRFIHTQAFEES